MEPIILGPEYYEKKRKAALQRARERAIDRYRCDVKMELIEMDLPEFPTRDSYIVGKLVNDFISKLPDTQNAGDFLFVSDRSASRLRKKLRQAIREVEGWTEEELERRAKNANDVYNNRYRWIASERNDDGDIDSIELKIIYAMRRQQVEPGSRLEASIFHKIRNDLVAELKTRTTIRNRMYAQLELMLKLRSSFMDNLVSKTMAEVGAGGTELDELKENFRPMELDKGPMPSGTTT